MSAKDTLDRYEADWLRHLEWRSPQHESQTPGTYVDTDRGIGGSNRPSVRFGEIPPLLRTRVAERLESAIADLVLDEHTKLLSQLQKEAVAEAKLTLSILEKRDP